jgi:hypothetical protein
MLKGVERRRFNKQMSVLINRKQWVLHINWHSS